MLPRLIRFRDAPKYLGMDKNRFNRDVRPHLIEIPIGKQGIAFDRLDLDAWVEHYKCCNGRPKTNRRNIWDETKKCQGLSNVETYGTSTKSLTAEEFAKVLAQVTSSKRKDI